MILIHGGYWRSYDKGQLSGYAKDYRDKGYATVCINYTYASSTVHYDKIMEDMDNAINYIQSHADDWRIADDTFALLGFSAGGVDETDPVNANSSPAHYLRNVPTLIVHSDNDNLLDISHVVNFMAKLDNNNIPYDFLELNSGHSSFYGNASVEAKIDVWMETWLR